MSKINPILQQQLQMLTTVPFKVDGNLSSVMPDEFNEIVFARESSSDISINEIKVVFEDYIIKPFEGFDFHDKWNNGVPPYSKIMYGTITKETQGMYYFEVHTETSNKMWSGWCPKKSCSVYSVTR